MKKLLSIFLCVWVMLFVISSVFAAGDDYIDTSNGWYWPLPKANTTLTGAYGEQRSGKLHQGIDIAANSWTEIRAARSGVVVASKDGYNNGMGNYVCIRHGKNSNGEYIFTTYMHMVDGSRCVSAGDVVDQNTKIGCVGSTGDSTGPHLHFHIFRSTSRSPSSYSPAHVNWSDLNAQYINPSPSSISYNYDGYVQAPTVATTNGKVLISWTDTYAESYNVRIKDQNGVCYDEWNVIENNIYVILPPQNYSVYIDNIYSNYFTATSTTQFSVSNNYNGPYTSHLYADTSGNNVVLNWDKSNNTSEYNIRIYDDNGVDFSVWGQNDNYESIVLPLGKYYAYVDSYNDMDCTKGKKITFYVTQSYLDIGKAKPTVSVSNGKTGICWSSQKNANKYNIRIKDSNGIQYDYWNVIDNEIYTVLPPSNYTVYIDSVNDYGYVYGDTVSFIVSEQYYGPYDTDIAVNTASDEITLTWKFAKNANKYNVRIHDKNGKDYSLWNVTQNSITTALPKGTYYAYIDSINDIDVTKGRTKQFNIIQSYYDIGSTTPQIDTGNNITRISWENVEKATKYNIRIVNSKGENFDYLNVTDHKLDILLPDGNYEIYIDSVNDYAHCESEKVSFTVLLSKYIIKYFSDNNTEFNKQEKIYGTDIVLSPTIPKYKNHKFLGWATTDYSIIAEYQPGDVFTNNANTTLYAVWEPVPYIETIVSKTDNGCNANINLYNIPETSKIIVAGYKNEKFVIMQTIDYTKDTETADLTGDIDNVKVMVWSSLSSLKPLTGVEEIPSSQWITE